jgi:MinD superfamily P-loop ATPase
MLQEISITTSMSSAKENSEVKLINSVAGTGALSVQSLFSVKGWVAVGEPGSQGVDKPLMGSDWWWNRTGIDDCYCSQ